MNKTLEKKLRDKRFRENEDKVLRLFFEYGEKLTIGKIAKRLGVPRSTIYRHHPSVRAIVNDYVSMMKSKCNIRCRSDKEKDIKKFFRELLFFIVKNKKVFSLFLKVENKEALLTVLCKNKRALLLCVGFRFEADKAFNIYCKEVIEVIRMWGENDFDKQGIEVVLRDILYLTKTLKIRLGPLCNS
jgi:AcrR family transcriptional regulator